MQQKIAVAFVHGIEIDDPDYAATAIALLRRRFFERTGIDDDEALAIRAVYWSDVVQTAERELLYNVIGSRRGGFFGFLRSLVTKINAGSQLALLPFGLAALARWVPGLGVRSSTHSTGVTCA